MPALLKSQEPLLEPSGGDLNSRVSWVSWMYSVNAVEIHETFHWESRMRYQIGHFQSDLSSDRTLRLTQP
jgi:hypothetical protein